MVFGTRQDHACLFVRLVRWNVYGNVVHFLMNYGVVSNILSINMADILGFTSLEAHRTITVDNGETSSVVETFDSGPVFWLHSSHAELFGRERFQILCTFRRSDHERPPIRYRCLKRVLHSTQNGNII